MSEILSNPVTPGTEKKKKKEKKSIGEIQAEVSFKVEPSDIDPKSLDTADWPLLLKQDVSSFALTGPPDWSNRNRVLEKNTSASTDFTVSLFYILQYIHVY